MNLDDNPPAEASPVAKSPGQRHRPKSLNLAINEKSNSDVALRIVSPGLPQLNAELKTTMKISQQIEQQQRLLIAARNTGSAPPFAAPSALSSSSSANSAPATTVLAHSSTSSTAGAATPEGFQAPGNVPQVVIVTKPAEAPPDELDRISTPSSAKRLKRENIPAPLNLPLASSGKPSIQSAPIRLRPMPTTARYPQFPQRRYATVPPHQHTLALHSNQYQIQVQSYLQYQQQLLQQMYVRRPVYRAAHLPYVYAVPPPGAPYTPAAPYTPTGVHYSSIPNPYKRVRLVPQPTAYPVRSKLTPAAAPANTPSLDSSPAKAKLTLPPREETSSNASSSAVTDVYHGDYTKAAPMNSQPLSAQREFFDTSKKRVPEDESISEEEIREMQEKYAQPAVAPPHHLNAPATNFENLKAGAEMFGSINLMNESVFNFRIFTPEEGNQESIKDRLAREKEKFLKICETSWNEFVAKM